MLIDFQLSPSEEGAHRAAAAFAAGPLSGAKQLYERHADPAARFQATRPIYRQAVAGGLIKGLVPPHLGGRGGSLTEAALIVEELTRVEPSVSLTIFATGLGLMPLGFAGRLPAHERFLTPFLSGEGEPLASLVFSEPGGVANWLEPGAPGLQTTATLEGDEWVINGDKIWATNCAGWDFKGADLQCVVCRASAPAPGVPAFAAPADAILILLVTATDIARNAPGAYRVVRHVAGAGYTACSGPHVRFAGLRVPAATHVLCAPGAGAAVVAAAFDATAVFVGAMSVGVMRAAFDAALAFARADRRGGTVPLLARQAVADRLGDVKMAAEACRALTWKAAHGLERGPGRYDARRETALAAKVYCSEACVRAVTDAIAVVGMYAACPQFTLPRQR